MLIEIESIYGNKLIHGSHLDREELQNALKEILQTVSEKDFLKLSELSDVIVSVQQ